jgi:hypothetical protein
MTTAWKRYAASGAIVVLIAGLFGCGSTSRQKSASVTIAESGDGLGVQLTISEALARSLVEDVVGGELECGAELDADFAAVLEALDREGRGARVERRSSHGLLVARRTGRSLKLDIRDAGSDGRVEVSMPWAVATCLLDGSATLAGKDAAAIRVRVSGSGGSSFELAVR